MPSKASPEVRAEQVRLVFAGTRSGVGVSLIGVAFLFLVQFEFVPLAHLITWAAAMTTILLARVWVCSRFEARAPGPHEMTFWRWWVILSLGATSLTWSSFVLFLMPAGAVAQQMYTVMILACYASGSTLSMSYLWFCFLAFFAPMVVVIPLRFAALNEPYTLITAITFVVFSYFLFVASRLLNITTTTNIMLKLDNKDLADKAQQETRRVEAARLELEHLTQELRASNDISERALEQMTQDLALAKSLQESILPHDFAAHSGYEISAFMHAARQVDGDFYDVFYIDEKHLGVAIADVSGKGVASALFMAMSRALLGSVAEELRMLSLVLSEVNRRLKAQNPIKLFVTMFYGVIDLETGKITFGNAGHESPLLVRGDGSVQPLDPTAGMALGVEATATYAEKTAILSSGDTLFLYTDGINQAFDSGQNMFGRDRLVSVLKKANGASPEDIVSTVIGDVEKFVGDFEQSDDLTCLALTFKGGKSPASESHNFEIENDLKQIAALQAKLEPLLKRSGASDKDAFQLSVCVDEYLSNLISYAYKVGGYHKIQVRMSAMEDAIAIIIEDDGAPFDLREHEPAPDSAPISSSMWARMMSSKFVSAVNPSANARTGLNALGQLCTSRAIFSSGSALIKATAFSPAILRNASICSATVADTPGRFRARRPPSDDNSASAAVTRKPTAERGLACQARTLPSTGSTASLPAKGSRMMLEKNPDAAALGFPGRTQMLGRRKLTPSKNPLRE